MGTIYDWETLNRVVDELGLTVGADGKIDTSGLEANKAKMVNDLKSLYDNRSANSSPSYSYQTYNPAAEQTNVLKQKLEKYTNTINKRYGLSSEGASERAILKAQQDAARRIGAAMPTTSGGGGGGGGYDLDAEAEAIFEEYYNAVQGKSGTSTENGMMDGEEERVNELLAEYQRGMNHADKWALEEQIYSEAYGKLNSKAAYKALQDGIKSRDAYDTLVEILQEGTPEYFTRKNEELYADLVGDDKKKFDEIVDEYMKAEDEGSREANKWYEAFGGDGVSAEELQAFISENPDAEDEEILKWYEANGGDGASIEELQRILDKFPDASDSFRLALFDLIERKNENALSELMSTTPKTEDMDAVTAEEFLKAVDEFLDEEGNLDTSKVSQEWWDMNIADKYAEVWDKYGDYFEEEKIIDEETYQKRLAGEKAFVAEDGKEWYILRSGENDAAEFLERNREEAIDALKEQGYNNWKNPDIEDGTIIEVNYTHLMYDDGQWRYVGNNKNAYKNHVVVDGRTYKLGRELTADEIKDLELGEPDKNTVRIEATDLSMDSRNKMEIYFNGKWYVGR